MKISKLSLGPIWFNGFVAMLVIMPVPFGSNRPWISDLFGVVCALLLIVLSFDIYKNRELLYFGAPKRRLALSAVLIFIVSLWSFLQTQSWMPDSWHHPVWNYVNGMPNAFSGSISIEPDLFPESLARILGYTACFLLAFFGGRDATRAKLLLKSLGFAAVFYALYGLLMQSLGVHMVLWLDKWAYQNTVTSTFINKNSYATYAALGFQCCLMLLWQVLKKKPVNDVVKDSYFVAVLEKFGTRDIFYILMCAIVFGALVLTGSRAGLGSGLAGCFAMLVALAINRHWRWRRWLPILIVGIVVLLGFMIFGDTTTIDRLDQQKLEVDAPIRLNAYIVAISAIKNSPWLGFGLGSFESAFRLYRDSTVYMWFQHAHNDYLELMLELGIPAAIMYIVAILSLISCCAVGVIKRKRQEIYPILAIAASVTVGIHSLADFSMQIPAISATYAALLGLGVAQSWSSKSGR